MTNTVESNSAKKRARRYGAPAPNLSLDQQRLGIGYKLQEQKSLAASRDQRERCRGK